ncbi:MAG: methyl-accepting chemotaxis protein [Lachnospiraceae bacterium]|nr:methyl-accepting chemotaxis protein [Lachnospiraceae bacterium]
MKKRRSLKNVMLSQIIIFVAIIIIILTQIGIKLQADNIQPLVNTVLAREANSYASEVHNWWNGVETRVEQTADVIRNAPEMSYDDTLAMLLKLTEKDPDSQDIYIAYGDTNKFLDGSGWIPGSDFVFNDRAWFQGALSAGGEIYTSEPYVDASTGKTCLACAIMIRDKVVLSSDVVFDKVAKKITGFESIAPDARYYIINKETKDILVSSNAEIVGQNLSDTTDPVMKGLATVFDKMNTSVESANKTLTVKTGAGSMMFTATDIEDTSWVVVSAVSSNIVGSRMTKVMVITFVTAIILLAILSVIIFFTIRKYLNPVSKATKSITDISNGDFTVTLVPEGNNEITTLCESLNEYIANMRGTLNSLADVSNNMHQSAGECYEISNTLAGANKTQSESIERLNATLNEMNSSIEEIATAASELANTSSVLSDNAENVKNLCDQTMESSATGKDEMENMTSNVRTLNDTIAELTELIHNTAKSIEEITGITDTINAISEQTNLLSLNASIEAARAGEAGRGFAVVATEVGALAQQSTEATVNIRNLISDITKNIENINEKADRCVEDMSACLTGVENANVSFNNIYEDVAKATDGIVEIASGIEKINDVATNNASTTQQQASTINEILALSDSIVAESEKLATQTENISTVSGDLNKYSDEINSDLSQYKL